MARELHKFVRQNAKMHRKNHKTRNKEKNAAKKKKCQNVVRGRGGLSYLVAKMSSGRHILAGQKWWLESRAEGEWQAQTAFRFRFFPKDLKAAQGDKMGQNASLGRAFFG